MRAGCVQWRMGGVRSGDCAWPSPCEEAQIRNAKGREREDYREWGEEEKRKKEGEGRAAGGQTDGSLLS